MDSLKKFEIKKTVSEKLFGGRPKFSHEEWVNDEGCKVKYTDVFEDCDNDGVWDEDESGTGVTESKC
jgi:hypothetical protein